MSQRCIEHPLCAKHCATVKINGAQDSHRAAIVRFRAELRVSRSPDRFHAVLWCRQDNGEGTYLRKEREVKGRQ